MEGWYRKTLCKKETQVKKLTLIIVLFCVLKNCYAQQLKIDRYVVVERHRVVNTHFDTLSSLTVGNGSFAFTVDATGLQSFPEYYKKGVPLGTESEWGWHSFPNTARYTEAEALKEYTINGKEITYAVQPKQPQRAKEAADYFRINQHRLQLGNVGLDITMKNGQPVNIGDIRNIHQELDPWTGAITSRFTVENIPVFVTTYCNQQVDAIATKIISPLLKSGQIKLRIRFPYPTGAFADFGVNYSGDEKHTSSIVASSANNGLIRHQLDTTMYYVKASWKGIAKLEKVSAHYFTLTPAPGGEFEFNFSFSPSVKTNSFSYTTTKNSSEAGWKKFWLSGGAVDFSGSTDPRAFELERRVVLSQYLLKAQEAGSNPPQETGLTYNSWFGKPHMEMLWWHGAHYAFWNRTELLEKELNWYFKAFEKAKAIAKRQGFEGARWQKMTDNEGREVPSSVGAFLIWQQPHIIYFAEQIYRNRPDKKTLQKYKDLLFATADFMASFPTCNKEKNRYDLGKGLIPAQECFNAETTFNPTYELAYWSWALSTAQKWRERLGMGRNLKWDIILKKLAPLPERNGVYLATESTPDCYDSNSKVLIDHPAVLAALSTIPPSNNLDTATMHRTYNIVEKMWHWDDTWGWDFPLIAMTAVRLQQPELAVGALFKNIRTNTYLPNGHNYQDERLTIYLPGNGGLLSAVAMMCAGYDGNRKINPGFPKGWKVRWEGLSKLP
jgi:protein-glucosylgalactosylhydroxylysine glucosidase